MSQCNHVGPGKWFVGGIWKSGAVGKRSPRMLSAEPKC